MLVDRVTVPVSSSQLEAAPKAMSASVKRAPPWATPMPLTMGREMGMETRA